MPCSDVTEGIEIVVDPNDRLKNYTFQKTTCGQGVGNETLLAEELIGKKLDEILAYTAEAWLDEHPCQYEVDEFLSLKHLFAVQAALEVLTGQEPGGKDALCAAAEIGYDGEDLILSGKIAVDLVTDKIKSCGNCKSCGTSKKKKITFY